MIVDDAALTLEKHTIHLIAFQELLRVNWMFSGFLCCCWVFHDPEVRSVS